MITLTLPIEPVAKGRPRFGNGRTYTPAKTERFERDCARLAQIQFKRPALTGPLGVMIFFTVARPKRCKRKFPSVRPDVDNFQKAVCDALNGIVWADDGQIVRSYTEKLYGQKSEIKIYIEELE